MSADQQIENRLRSVVATFQPVFSSVWRNKGRLFAINLLVGSLTVAILFLLVRPYYDTSVKILPDYRSSKGGGLSQLSGVASLVGLGGLSLGQSIPPEIYEDLLGSESVQRPVIYAKYQTEEFENPVNLIEYLEIEPDSRVPESLRERQLFLDCMEELNESRIRISIDRISTILTLTVRMPESRLSADVANKLVRSLNEYLLFQNKSFAHEQMNYLNKRLVEVKDSLAEAEVALKSFQERNKNMGGSPDLMLRHARLLRAVELKQAVYIELVKQFEIAKLEGIRDTPILNIREEAGQLAEKTGPPRTVILLAVMLLVTVTSTLYYHHRSSIRTFAAIIRGRT